MSHTPIKTVRVIILESIELPQMQNLLNHSTFMLMKKFYSLQQNKTRTVSQIRKEYSSSPISNYLP